MTNRPIRQLTLAVISMCVAVVGLAQCTTTISAFPYVESFEGPTPWIAGGTNSDWAMGDPDHPNISDASDGVNAWCVGGLTGSFYTNGQQSWLETPCFDLAVLNYPWVRFAIYWETEPDYDGIGLQYSTDEGLSWDNLGSANEVEDCHTANWFNSTNITALNLASPRAGWSGTATTGGCASGGGEGAYVFASHCLAGLQQNVPLKLRFVFGAGTICNTFDGVAIDAFTIEEAPPLDADFGFVCAGNTVSFTGNGASGCVENGVWSFGDPGSGGANTATGVNAVHTYPGPGSYPVTFTITGSCGAPSTEERTIVVPEITFNVTPVGCTPNSGAVEVAVSGGNGPFTYAWDPGGATTASISDLAPGDYSVLVQATDMCAVQATATVGTDAATIALTEEHTDVSCNGSADGSATVSVTGGSGVFTYAWSPSGGGLATASGLGPDTYTCTVSDDAGCTASVDVEITEPDAVTVLAGPDTSLCSGAALTLSAEAGGGTGGHTFTWSPEGPAVTPTISTSYSVVATDGNGCSSAADVLLVTVVDPIVPSFTWSTEPGCAPVCADFEDVSGITGVRAWSFSDGGGAGDETTTEHCFTTAGVFDASLTITTAEGCSGTTSIAEVVTVSPSPVADFSASPDVASISSPVFQFFNTSRDAEVWNWSFGDPLNSVSSESSPSFTYDAVGCYTVTLSVAGASGCTDEHEELVCVEDAFTLFVPNTFTPNDDGINDGFRVRSSASAPPFFELVIHDRWGRVVFNTTDPNEAWEGDGLPIGVYAWQVKVRDRENQVHDRRGHVTLLR